MSRNSKRCRLDELLVARDLVPTRAQARGLILAGRVWRGTEVMDKPGQLVLPEEALRIEAGPRYVSRGGEKLAAFLDAYPLEIKGMDFLDIGASTGGFTDCLLQRGAGHATCVDVGRGQLHNRLLTDPRVTSLERINARELDAAILPRGEYRLVVMDVSFISLTKVLEPCWRRVAVGGTLIALIKPQFEATRAEATKGRGIIRDETVRQRVLGEIVDFVRHRLPGAVEIGRIDCPLAGADGNREFLAGWRKDAPSIHSI